MPTQFTINANTSVVLVDCQPLTSGNSAVVYVSSVQTPGQVITIRDSTGYLSSPQSIVVSTTTGVKFADGTTSIILSQPYESISIESRDPQTWNLVNTFGFPLYQTIANVAALNTSSILTQNLYASNAISTSLLNAQVASVRSTLDVRGPTYVSSLAVGAFPETAGQPYSPYAFYVDGFSFFNSNVNVGSDLHVVGSISTGASLFVGGSISTLANLNVAGNMTVAGPTLIRGLITGSGSVSLTSNVSVGGNVIVGGTVTVGNTINTNSNLTATAIGASTFNVMSSLTFNTTRSIIPTLNAPGLTFSDPLNLPGLSTNSLTVNSDLTVPNLAVTGAIYAPTASLLQLDSTNIQNPNGSLTIQTIATNSLQASTLQTNSLYTSSLLTSSISLYGNLLGNQTSLITANVFNANSISTGILTASSIKAGFFNFSTLNVSSIAVTSSLQANGGVVNTDKLIFDGVNMTVSSIGATSITASSIVLASGRINQLQPLTIRPSLQTPYATISTVNASTLTTSTLQANRIVIGGQSLVEDNGPFLLTSNVLNMTVSGRGTSVSTLSFIYQPSIEFNTTVNANVYINWNNTTPTPGSVLNLTVGYDNEDGSIFDYINITGQNGQSIFISENSNLTVNSNFTIDTSILASSNVFNIVGTLGYFNTFYIYANYQSNVNYTNIDSNSILTFRNGGLKWDYALNDTVIRNPFNDMTIRNVFYYGSINNTSDPALKEQIELANVSTCYETIRTLPLRRFKYTDAYISSFQLQDIHRLGVLSTEVGKHFPKSITPIEIPGFEGPIQTVDMQQVDMAHIGATKYLMDKVDTLTRDIEETLQQISSYKG